MKSRVNLHKLGPVVPVLAAVATGMLVFGHGCSDMKPLNSSGGSASSSSLSDSALQPDFIILPKTKTMSTLYSNQIMDSMMACAGVKNPSNATQDTLESRKGSFSDFGYVTTVTSPMLMSAATLAGEVCNDLVNQESTASDKKVFKDIRNSDLVAATSTASSGNINQLTAAMRRLAQNCWQREPTSQEQDLIVSNLTGTEDAVWSTQESAVAICTLVLSSLSSVTN